MAHQHSFTVIMPSNCLQRFRRLQLRLAALPSIRTILVTAIALGGFLCASSIWQLPAMAQPSQQPLFEAVEQLELEGKQRAQSRDFEGAIAQFQQAISIYRDRDDPIGEAIVQSHLAAVYAQVDQWEEANRAIETSLDLLPSREQANSQGEKHLLAQVLDVRGRLYFDLGQLEEAFETWSRAQVLFAQSQDLAGYTRTHIEQARVLQALGFYGRAIDRLEPLVKDLELQPDSLLKASSLRSLGNALLLAGEIEGARQVLERSLLVAQALEETEAVASSQLSLGNAARYIDDPDLAIERYARAAAVSTNPDLQLQAQLNQLDVLLASKRWQSLEEQLVPLQNRISELPSSRSTLQARIDLLSLMTDLRAIQPAVAPTPANIIDWATVTQHQAQDLSDRRSEAQTLGLLGHLYEQSQQYLEAKQLTTAAIALARTDRSFDIVYRWQWQFGRILAALDDTRGAVAAYQSALKTLDTLRADLVAVNPDVQFAFKDSVEPVHRQLVDLLLTNSGAGIDSRLDLARQTIERLQLAELDNFFRAACIDYLPIAIDTIDPQAAVIYPIVLPDRLELLLHLPGQPLKQFTVNVTSDQIDWVVDRTRLAFGQRTSPRYLPLAQQLYDWIVKPIERELAESGVDTLVFVPDGVLRNVPMGALHDGDRYLLEIYAVVLSPGLELLPPEPIDRREEKVLSAGLSVPRQGFSALPHVATEIGKIDEKLSGRVLLDGEFTQRSLQKAMGDDDYSFVHIATHGQFSSQLDRTFLLAWDGNIDINQLRYLLLASDFSRDRPVDLLVLSACETAAGDRQAALGLAGMATRAGARSTVATLWQVNDLATAEIVNQFYQNLVQGKMTKAQALQQAQLSVYRQADDTHRHPFYWASFVLVGNWQ